VTTYNEALNLGIYGKMTGSGFSQCVQYTQSKGGIISNNVCDTKPGVSKYLEDNISVHKTFDTVVKNNRVRGRAKGHGSACCVTLADSGGGRIKVLNNIFSECGNCGLGGSGGFNNEMIGNVLYTAKNGPYSGNGYYSAEVALM
jgi:hypothetical protein